MEYWILWLLLPVPALDVVPLYGAKTQKVAIAEALEIKKRGKYAPLGLESFSSIEARRSRMQRILSQSQIDRVDRFIGGAKEFPEARKLLRDKFPGKHLKADGKPALTTFGLEWPEGEEKEEEHRFGFEVDNMFFEHINGYLVVKNKATEEWNQEEAWKATCALVKAS